MRDKYDISIHCIGMHFARHVMLFNKKLSKLLEYLEPQRSNVALSFKSLVKVLSWPLLVQATRINGGEMAIIDIRVFINVGTSLLACTYSKNLYKVPLFDQNQNGDNL